MLEVIFLLASAFILSSGKTNKQATAFILSSGKTNKQAIQGF